MTLITVIILNLVRHDANGEASYVHSKYMDCNFSDDYICRRLFTKQLSLEVDGINPSCRTKDIEVPSTSTVVE